MPPPITSDPITTELPQWNLADLYKGFDDPKLTRDKQEARNRAEALAERWRGHIVSDDVTADDIAGLITEYEAINEVIDRMSSFAGLASAGDMTDAAIGQQAQIIREFDSEISALLVFVQLELAKIDDDRMAKYFETPKMAYWRPWLRLVRASRPHQLSDDIEVMLMERSPSGRQAWVRLFDETAASLRFPISSEKGGEDEILTEAEILDMMTDADPANRKKAGLSRSKVLADNSRLMALIFNTIAKDKNTEDKWRSFASPIASRNLANDVDDDVVDGLAASVTGRMPELTHRYYAIKAKWMGGKKLPWWDRNAPPPGEDKRKFSWQQAKDLVLDSFAEFDDEIAAIAKRFFDEGWIDAKPRPNKASGAFSHPTVPSAHPYILLNYSGNVRDVMTLAHELGHGVHQVMAAEKGHFMSGTPLTLAETASVFGEMLVFRNLLAQTTDKNQRRALLAGKIEDMLNTVVRQIGFHNFESQFHNKRLIGELTAAEIEDIWMKTQAEALGPAIDISDNYRPIWGFIPHFIHAPFYVYAYAFGDCLVNVLWQIYAKTDSEAAKQDFVKNYHELLKSGGTKRYDAALEAFGLSPKDSGFWSQGIDTIAAMIDELEAMLAADNEG